MARKKNAKVTDVQLTKPQTRLERYLGTIAGLFSNAPTDPRTRLERYLDAIVNGGVPITPDTPTSVEGLLYGNSEGKVEGILPDLTAEEIAARIEAAKLISEFPRPNILYNAYFVGGGSQQGDGQFPINKRAGYVVPDGVTYYSDSALTTSAGTTSAYTTAVYVNTTYGTIDTSGTTYYVAYEDMVAGYTNLGYGIDGWYQAANGTLTIDSDCIIVKNSDGGIVQRVESYPLNTELTFSALVKGNGDIQLWGGAHRTNFDSSNYTVVSFTYTLDTQPNNFFGCPCINPHNDIGVSVKAAKLELGDHQTLAHQENGVWVLNEVPNFQQELAKCQRCQVVLRANYSKCIGTGAYYAQNISSMLIPLPVTLRSRNPSISLIGTLRNVYPGGIVNITQAFFGTALATDNMLTINMIEDVKENGMIDGEGEATLIIDANLY